MVDGTKKIKNKKEGWGSYGYHTAIKCILPVVPAAIPEDGNMSNLPSA